MAPWMWQAAGLIAGVGIIVAACWRLERMSEPAHAPVDAAKQQRDWLNGTDPL